MTCSSLRNKAVFIRAPRVAFLDLVSSSLQVIIVVVDGKERRSNCDNL